MKTRLASPIPATQFKTQCLSILETVRVKRTTVVISKHGRPVAKLMPVEVDPTPELYGSMEGTVREIGDIVSPLNDEWDAAKDE